MNYPINQLTAYVEYDEAAIYGLTAEQLKKIAWDEMKFVRWSDSHRPFLCYIPNWMTLHADTLYNICDQLDLFVSGTKLELVRRIESVTGKVRASDFKTSVARVLDLVTLKDMCQDLGVRKEGKRAAVFARVMECVP